MAGGCRVTTPLRTAWDLGRHLDRTEAVVAVEFRRGADNHRDIDASELGWETMRFQAAEVWVTPGRTAGAVARLLEACIPSR